MPETDFKVLKRRAIYSILDGDKKDLVTIPEYNQFGYGLPYMTANNLEELALDFTCDLLGSSRGDLVGCIIDKAIEDNRCNDLLDFFFDRSRFSQLNSIEDIDEIDRVYQLICSAAIDAINHELRLGNHQLLHSEGKWHIVESGCKPELVTPEIDKLNLAYVQGLKTRCAENLQAGDYDSVVTKSRTMLEELLIHILEDNKQQVNKNGDIIQYYNAVKDLYGLRGNANYDQRVNSLLNGLERIVQSVAELRNSQSDAHGAGSGRIAIKDREARLIMNSSIVLCEYLLSIHRDKMNKGSPPSS